MPTFSLNSHTYAAGEVVTTPSFTVHVAFVEASLTLDLTDVQLRDPTTNVKAAVEWAPAGTPDVSSLWSELGSCGLVGKPTNRLGLKPSIFLNPAQSVTVLNNLVRGRIENKSATTPITFSGTATFT